MTFLFYFCTHGSLADRMEVDGAGESVTVTKLHQLFSREYIQLYLKIASTATAQVSQGSPMLGPPAPFYGM